MKGTHPRGAGIFVSTALVVCLSTAGADGSTTSERSGLLLYSTEISGRAQLFTVRADGTGRRQLTRGPTEALNAEWSPGGRSMATDGSGIRELTPTGYQGDPSFTPDGRSLVYTRDPAPGDNGIWIMKTDGTSVRRLTATRSPAATRERPSRRTGRR